MQLSNYGEFPTKLPVIVEDDLFLYPFMISPIFLTDQQNIDAANLALEDNSLVIVVPTKSEMESERTFDAVHSCGVIGSVMRKVTLPDGRTKILFQGLEKGEILEEVDDEPLIAIVGKYKLDPYNDLKVNATLEILREKVRTLSTSSDLFPPDLLKTIEENHEPNRIVDLIASTVKLNKKQAYKLFTQKNLEERLFTLLEFISQQINSSKLQREIKSKVHSRIEQVNKEYFLKEQLKQIQKELGEDTQRDEEIEEYRQKLSDKKAFMQKDAFKEVNKQIDRFSRMHPDSADANMIQGYLDWVLEIPFGKFSKRKLDIHQVKKQLDSDHYSLEKPKDRIEEYFAVKELKEKRGVKDKDGRGEILCFIGPPGVGKTSLANSISKALRRKLIRVALGGLEDVNELRGHRRTYIGAMPGRIVQGLIEAKEMDPVIVLDEIDKVARNHRGDPTSVLLEILDPEQNHEYRDYYLNFNIDLSRIIFIATANEIAYIPVPLRDRMEFIFVSSYTPDEKYQIAKKYLIPQELKKHGLKKIEFSIAKNALELLISNYTREAGVRNLRRRVAEVLRKVAKTFLEDSTILKVCVNLKNLDKFLDKEVFSIDEKDNFNSVGIVNGLAWTAVGGDVLKIEAIKLDGKGALQLTGKLGEVMKESARIALSVIRLQADEKKLDLNPNLVSKHKKESEELKPSDIYKNYDLHIHVPEGATPKDGPSAGIAMATAIASIISGKAIHADIAMTGELTLSGKVLSIGGLKEKLIAAHKAKIKIAIIPQKNLDIDLEDIPDIVKDSMEIIGVSRIEEVLEKALV